MTEITLEYNAQDLARLHRALTALESKNLMKSQWNVIGLDIIAAVSPYPAETWRNVDRGVGYWYERGYGYRGTKDVGRTSAPLGKKWYHTVYPDYLKVGNLADYANKVQGEEQSMMFALIGWRRLSVTAKQMMPAIIRKLEAYARKVWDRTT